MGEARWLTVDRVHDLLSEHRSAELTVSGSMAPHGLLNTDSTALREHLAGLMARPGSTISFHDLATGPRPQLVFGIGAMRSPAPDEGHVPVTFRIEGRRRPPAPAEGAGWQTLFEKTIVHAELPPPTAAEIEAGVPAGTRAAFHQLPLSDGSPALWELRFTSEQPELLSTQMPVEWPGWIAPQLLSDGRRLRRSQHPVLWEVTHANLLDSLDAADIQTQQPELPVAFAALDAAYDVPTFGGLRHTLRMAAPAAVTWQLDVPADATLQVELGMDTDTGWSLPGDGMIFAVVIDGTSAWRFDCDAPQRQRDRGWKTGSIDLSPWAGRRVDLTLVTDVRLDPNNDVGGWSRVEVMTEAFAPRRLTDEAPTVIVLLADTLRADSVGAFGNDPGVTPFIDALVARGLRFSSARATSSWTWPSTASLFTGLYPPEHGLIDHRDTWLDDELTTLAECFQAAGYSTAAFIANTLIDDITNMGQGFETFVNLPNATAGSMVERVEAWLADTEGTARLLYVHFMDPHAPYSPPDPWLPAGTYDPRSDIETIDAVVKAVRLGREDDVVVRDFTANLVQRYDSEVRYLDAVVGDLLAVLQAHGGLDDALVVFTADHGEEFGEHRLLSHGGNLYEATLRVPLSITGFGPSAREAATIEREVLNMDLLPTLCSLAGLPIPEHLSDRPLLHEDQPAEPTFAQTLHGFDHDIEGFVEKLGVTYQGFKLVYTPVTGVVELYDLAADPEELHDLSGTQPGRTRALMAQLSHWRETTLQSPDSSSTGDSAELLRRMQQLGYIER